MHVYIWCTYVCTYVHICIYIYTASFWYLNTASTTSLHSWMRQPPPLFLRCVTWLIRTYVFSYVCDLASLLDASASPPFSEVCDVTHSYVRGACLICMCDMTHTYVCHDSFMCVTWLMHTCDMTHSYVCHDSKRCDTLQRTATHCNALQHTATHYNTLHHTAPHCNTLQHATKCITTLQHTATYCNTLQHTATHCNTLQYTATHCNTGVRGSTQHSASSHCTHQPPPPHHRFTNSRVGRNIKNSHPNAAFRAGKQNLKSRLYSHSIWYIQ